MSLRNFLIAVCVSIGVGVSLFLFLVTSRVTKSRMAEMESLYESSVLNYATTVLLAKRYLLTTYLDTMSRDKTVARALILSQGSLQGREALASSLKKQMDADIVEVTPYRRQQEVSRFSIQPHNQRLALLVGAPVVFNGESIGGIRLGYYLDDVIPREIEAATHTSVRFLTGPTEKGRPLTILGEGFFIQIAGKSLLSVASSLQNGVIALSLLFLLGAIGLLYFFLQVGFVRGFQILLTQIEQATLGLERGSHRSGSDPATRRNSGSRGALPGLRLAFNEASGVSTSH